MDYQIYPALTLGEIAMNLQSILATSLLAMTAALSTGVQAASDTNTTTAAQAPAAGAQADKAMKPHSHMEEKSGVPQKAPVAKDKKPDPTKDKNRHLHPRDGK
ncbi:MAG: hypothetical protein ACYCVW_08130 [Rhodocyclaceae bacterium]